MIAIALAFLATGLILGYVFRLVVAVHTYRDVIGGSIDGRRNLRAHEHDARYNAERVSPK